MLLHADFMIWHMDHAAWIYAVALSLPLSLFIDRWLGEPPTLLHPVIWMGRLLDFIGRHSPRGTPALALLSGTVGWLLGGLWVVIVSALLQSVLFLQHAYINSTLITALLLALSFKPLMSLRLLIEECVRVERALERSVHHGRKQTSRICSRDTQTLDATALRETAVESLSENFTDSVVAPMFWFVIAGLPGAALYRWVNTADAMWGYRDIQNEWFGKVAARSDDVMNWLPARLSALALWPAGRFKQLLREAGKTPSPNSGWPMAALALKLNIRLAKPRVYILNDNGRKVDGSDIERTAHLVNRAAWYSVLGLVIVVVLFSLTTTQA